VGEKQGIGTPFGMFSLKKKTRKMRLDLLRSDWLFPLTRKERKRKRKRKRKRELDD